MKKIVLLFISVFSLQILLAQNPPVAVNDTFSINKNNLVILPVLSNDYDIDGDPLTITILIPPVHGTASDTGNQITYLPNMNYFGYDSLTYIICDTTNRCDTATVLIIIDNVNNRPVAANDTFSINKNNTTTLPVLSNDYDADGDPLTITVLIPPAHGTDSVSNNQIVYIPDFNFSGTDSIVYVVCDTAGGCDTATVFITIGNADNAPVAVNDTFSIPTNPPSVLPVISNDYDPDGGPLSVTILIPPVHGTASVINNTQIAYSSNQNYFGIDSFVYILCDSAGLCDTATVYIHVGGSNSAPVAVDDYFSFGDTLVTVLINVVGNDSDPQNDSLFVTEVTDLDSSNHLGTLTIDSATGNLLFVRNEITCGTESFEYVVCDFSLCDTGTVTVTINCPATVFLPEGFSPDGDGLNDKLVFTGLEYFAPASLKIYNRYGTSVYDNPDYKNDWDGTMENHKAVPDGTYFYVLQLNDKRKYNNYLIINR